MTLTEHGKIQNGGIVLDKPLSLPEGTEVTVQIEPATAMEPAGAPPERRKMTTEEFLSLPFFGMWKDREDMKDSVAWVERERAKWHQRSQRRD